MSHTVDGEYHSDVLFSTFILLLLTPYISQAFIYDYETAKTYLFVRMHGCTKWYKIKLLQSFFYCFFSQLVYNLTLLTGACLVGFTSQNFSAVLLYVIFGILSGTLTLFMFVASAEIFSLFIKPHLAISVLVGFCMIIMVSSCFLDHLQVRYSPLTCYCISWHIYQYGTPMYLLPYPAWVNYICILITEIIAVISGSILFKKKDHI